MPLPVTFATLPTGNNPASLLDTEFAAVAAMAMTYCTATGTNTILLSVAPNQPTPTGYANGQQFSFIAPANSTGPVTVQVGSLAALPLRAAGQPLGAGALTAGAICEFIVTGNGTTADLVGGGGFLPLTGGTLTGNLAITSPAGLRGTSTNDSAAAGNVGEVISSNVTGALSLTTSVAVNLSSISLTAGDWNVQGEVWHAVGTGGASTIGAGITTVSATMPTTSALNQSRATMPATIIANSIASLVLRPAWISLASTTTVYLVCTASFPSGTCTATGNIWARRAR